MSITIANSRTNFRNRTYLHSNKYFYKAKSYMLYAKIDGDKS